MCSSVRTSSTETPVIPPWSIWLRILLNLRKLSTSSSHPGRASRVAHSLNRSATGVNGGCKSLTNFFSASRSCAAASFIMISRTAFALLSPLFLFLLLIRRFGNYTFERYKQRHEMQDGVLGSPRPKKPSEDVCRILPLLSELRYLTLGCRQSNVRNVPVMWLYYGDVNTRVKSVRGTLVSVRKALVHSAACGRNQRWLPRGGPDLTCGDSISNLTSR
jgi:hypothetical protein